MLLVSKETRLPFMKDLGAADDLPHTLSFGIMYRAKIDSFQELPEEKRPPRNLWDKPHKLEKFFDEVFERNIDKKEYIDLDLEDVE